MTVSGIARFQRSSFFYFFSLPAVGVSCNSSCGESSNTMETLISDMFKGNYPIALTNIAPTLAADFLA